MPFRTRAEQVAASPIVSAHLRRGGLVAYPTETVYGFGCGLQNEALERLVFVKQRALDKAFLLLVLDAYALDGVEWTRAARALASAFWPGPLTLALRAEPGAFPSQVLSANGTVAIRVTSHGGVRTLLEAYGEPLTSTSANLPGQPPARSAAATRSALQGSPLAADFIFLDGGTLRASPPSTIVDCSVEPPRVLRAGAISEAELAETINEIGFR